MSDPLMPVLTAAHQAGISRLRASMTMAPWMMLPFQQVNTKPYEQQLRFERMTTTLPPRAGSVRSAGRRQEQLVDLHQAVDALVVDRSFQSRLGVEAIEIVLDGKQDVHVGPWRPSWTVVHEKGLPFKG